MPVARSASMVFAPNDGKVSLARSSSLADITSYNKPTNPDNSFYRYMYNPWIRYGALDDYWYDRYRFYRSPHMYGNDYLLWRYRRRLYQDYYPYSSRSYRSYLYPYYGDYLRDYYYGPYRNPPSIYYAPYWYYF
uniref:Uncharacterized protein n=1 Tax=Acrobeloides nanus TaxID=290746 RepID=A0A914DPQ9_9BILA